jgi:hypothetical protein
MDLLKMLQSALDVYDLRSRSHHHHHSSSSTSSSSSSSSSSISASDIIDLCFEVTNSMLGAAYDLHYQSMNLALKGTPTITGACDNLVD